LGGEFREIENTEAGALTYMNRRGKKKGRTMKESENPNFKKEEWV